MKKTHIGGLVTGVGAVMALIAFIKLAIIGYYPDEFVPFIVLMLAGAGVLALGNKIYRTGKLEGE
ncbi:hypothetical protein [Ruania rhizosphaerae]|uniref:hypothetical protein n=1 Tax=Ruania rhizosphaerae TaxID=1840413 RepID=UPI00135725C0|nr:hypothetical protein [Ruania rhizosphaerae]